MQRSALGCSLEGMSPAVPEKPSRKLGPIEWATLAGGVAVLVALDNAGLRLALLIGLIGWLFVAVPTILQPDPKERVWKVGGMLLIGFCCSVLLGLAALFLYVSIAIETQFVD